MKTLLTIWLTGVLAFAGNGFSQEPPPLPEEGGTAAGTLGSGWYYGDGTKRMGPFRESEIGAKIRSGTITEKTPVWKTGMGDWEMAGKVAGLDRYFAPTPPPVPHRDVPVEPVEPVVPVEEKHRIDREMEAAQDRNPSTAGQVEAIEAAHLRWDALLNESYVALLGKLDRAGQNRLRDRRAGGSRLRIASNWLLS